MALVWNSLLQFLERLFLSSRALAALVAFTFTDVELSAAAIEIYKIKSGFHFDNSTFTFAGYMMAESKSPQRLSRLAEAVFGWLPGGAAIWSW